jgi:hypothetical protein
MDDHDPALLAVPDAGEGAGLALEDDLAVVGAVRVHPGEHLHQRRLAGTVLAADRVDLAAAHRQVDLLQRLHAGEGLGDPAHLQDVLGSHQRPLARAGWDGPPPGSTRRRPGIGAAYCSCAAV